MPDRVIRTLNGPRGAALAAAGVLALTHAFTYSPLVVPPSSLPLGLDMLAGVVPMWAYVVAWALGGVVALRGSSTGRDGRQRDHWDAWGFAWVVGLLFTWGVAYLGGWLLVSLGLIAGHEPGRAYLAGIMYLSVAVVLASSARMTNEHGEGFRAYLKAPPSLA